MRSVLIAGNWKMNLDRAGAVALARDIAAGAGQLDSVELAVCPPSLYLDVVGTALEGSKVALGAQNVYDQPHGAFTGEISTAMLLDLGCRYVILGHSERRHVLGETDLDVHRKLRAVLAAEHQRRRLTPIVCVGEELGQREAGQTHEVIRRQFEGSLAGLSDEQIGRVVLAYEPVWAIGTGKVATPEQADEIHQDLRSLLAQSYNAEIAQKVLILYGGSVKPDNAVELLAEPNVDGALVGGASLKADDFLAIAEAARRGV